MSETLTSTQKVLSKKYLLYQLFTNLWFVSAVWLYFYRIFITDQQIGIMDAMAFAIGLLAEIPSGALADKFGRGRMVKIGQFLAGSGLFLQAFADGFLIIFIGQTIMMVGVAFVSGADEALFFDKLRFKKDSVHWKKLVTRGGQIALVGTLVATICGGLSHELNPRLPWVLTGTSFVFSIAFIWSMKDERTQSLETSLRDELFSYIKNIIDGCKEFRAPQLALYVPIIIALQGLFYANGYGLLRIILLDRFTFTPFWGSVAVATSSLITIGLLGLMHTHAEKLREKTVFIVVALTAVAALLLSLANIGLWGYVVILVLYAGERLLYPSISESINNNSSEDRRATVLSIASFLKTLPYVLLAPLIGFLNTKDQLEYFLIGWSILILLLLVLYMRLKSRT